MRTSLVRLFFTAQMLLLAVLPALAQDEVAGRTVTQQDWMGFMPIVIGSIIVVIVVDTVFILPIFRKKDDVNEGNQA